MSSSVNQSLRDIEVSVQTQSISALNSKTNGININLESDKKKKRVVNRQSYLKMKLFISEKDCNSACIREESANEK